MKGFSGPSCDEAVGKTKSGYYDCYLYKNGFDTDGLEDIDSDFKFNLNSGPNEGEWARTEMSFTPTGGSASWPVLKSATYKMSGAGAIGRCTDTELEYRNSSGKTVPNICPTLPANEDEHNYTDGWNCSRYPTICEVKDIPKNGEGTDEYGQLIPVSYPKSCCLKSTIEII